MLTSSNLKITRFEIKGLRGKYDVAIDIADNRFVLVGVNGIGKSTVLNIFYYLVSQQWEKLDSHSFTEISLEVNGQRASFTKKALKARSARALFGRIFPPSTARKLVDLRFTPLFNALIGDQDSFEQNTAKLAEVLQVSPVGLHRIRAELLETESSLNAYLDSDESFRESSDIIRKNITQRIIYLPTYRRVEKDLKAIIPDLEERVRAYKETSSFARSEKKKHVELVEFGMEDVQKIIDSTMFDLNIAARKEFNDLAGEYLREVVRGEGDKFDHTLINSLGADEITSIINRVEEHTLNENDKILLTNAINTIKTSPENLTHQQKYIAHFFSKLVSIVRSLEGRESPVTKFKDLCNNYLFGKSVEYNNKSYHLSVKLDDNQTVDLKDLSSGEKQIVSLFCHLHLATKEKCIVIIDEPELSLSIDWQLTFLPDIIASEHCSFLASVTHSPFITDNELDPYTADLFNLMKKRSVQS